MSLVKYKDDIDAFLDVITLKENVKINLEKPVLKQIFKDALLQGIPDTDFVKFVHKCQQLGANPTLDQAYLIPYQVGPKDNKKITGQILFHYAFVESVANQQGDYKGFTRETKVDDYFNPETGEVQKMLRSDVVVKRGDREFPFTAWYKEYAKYRYGQLSGNWKSAPYMMLEKCALVGALRRAYPEAMSGMYISEESGFMENVELQEKINRQEIKDEEAIEIKKIQDEKLIEKLEKSDEIDAKIELIKNTMSELCEGYDLKNKAEAMKTYLKVSKFDELKNKTLDELDELYKIVSEVKNSLKKKKKEASKASFKMED